MKRKLAGAVVTMLVAAPRRGLRRRRRRRRRPAPTTTTARRATAPLTKAAVHRAPPTRSARRRRDKIAAAGDEAARRRREDGHDARRAGLEVPRRRRRCRPTTRMLDELRALTPPKADEKAIDGYVAALAGGDRHGEGRPVQVLEEHARPNPFDDANARAIDLRHEGLRHREEAVGAARARPRRAARLARAAPAGPRQLRLGARDAGGARRAALPGLLADAARRC